MKHILDYQLTVAHDATKITSELTGPGLFDDVRDTIWRKVMDT